MARSKKRKNPQAPLPSKGKRRERKGARKLFAEPKPIFKPSADDIGKDFGEQWW